MLLTFVENCIKTSIFKIEILITRSKPSQNRIEMLDALRGFALLGILLAHINHWYAAGPLPPEPIHPSTTVMAVPAMQSFTISEFINAAFINGKFYPLFTFIFGISFFLQTASFKKHTSQVDAILLRRAFFLFLIGLLHQMFWTGDILMVYACMMLPLMLLRRLNNTVLLVVGIIFIIDLPGIGLEIYQSITRERHSGSDLREAQTFLHVISNGTLLENIGFNLHILPGKLKFQAISGRLFFTLGFFIVGKYAARKGWVNLGLVPTKHKWIAILGAFVALVGLQFLVYSLNYDEMTSDFTGIIVGNLIICFQSIAAVVFYASLIGIIADIAVLQPLFKSFTNLGKMALTSYLLQTAIGVMLFYHIGFGLFHRTSQVVNIVIGLFIYVGQLLLANLWYRHFNYGLMEWLLRGGTYGSFQKLRKA